MFINCRTSPSAMMLVASDKISITLMLPVSTIIWKERVWRKSPTRTLAGLPNVSLAVALPLRSVDASTTSSCSRVAVWMSSTTAAKVWRCEPW